jgi:hypothetical protein
VEEVPVPMPTDAGGVAAPLLLDTATMIPPVGAAPVRDTVQVLEAPPTTLAGLQLREDTLTPPVGPDTEIVPPVPTMDSPVPVGSTPKTLPTEIAAVDTTLVKVMEATTPLEMIVEFIPVARHVYDPTLLIQESDFPAAVAADPATALTDPTAAVGKPMVHSSPAGSWPAGEETERLSVMVPPGAVAAELSVRLSG